MVPWDQPAPGEGEERERTKQCEVEAKERTAQERVPVILTTASWNRVSGDGYDYNHPSNSSFWQAADGLIIYLKWHIFSPLIGSKNSIWELQWSSRVAHHMIEASHPSSPYLGVLMLHCSGTSELKLWIIRAHFRNNWLLIYPPQLFLMPS